MSNPQILSDLIQHKKATKAAATHKSFTMLQMRPRIKLTQV